MSREQQERRDRYLLLTPAEEKHTEHKTLAQKIAESCFIATKTVATMKQNNQDLLFVKRSATVPLPLTLYYANKPPRELQNQISPDVVIIAFDQNATLSDATGITWAAEILSFSERNPGKKLCLLHNVTTDNKTPACILTALSTLVTQGAVEFIVPDFSVPPHQINIKQKIDDTFKNLITIENAQVFFSAISKSTTSSLLDKKTKAVETLDKLITNNQDNKTLLIHLYNELQKALTEPNSFLAFITQGRKWPHRYLGKTTTYQKMSDRLALAIAKIERERYTRSQKEQSFEVDKEAQKIILCPSHSRYGFFGAKSLAKKQIDAGEQGYFIVPKI